MPALKLGTIYLFTPIIFKKDLNIQVFIFITIQFVPLMI